MVVPVLSILTILLTMAYAGLILYLKRGWRRLALFRPQSRQYKTTVSVLIAARNEEDKLEKTILDILAQNYPADLLQLIVVDDHSTDRTSGIILSFAPDGVKLIKLNEARALNSYKKKAITEAIKLSDSELIVTTEPNGLKPS